MALVHKEVLIASNASLASFVHLRGCVLLPAQKSVRGFSGWAENQYVIDVGYCAVLHPSQCLAHHPLKGGGGPI